MAPYGRDYIKFNFEIPKACYSSIIFFLLLLFSVLFLSVVSFEFQNYASLCLKILLFTFLQRISLIYSLSFYFRQCLYNRVFLGIHCYLALGWYCLVSVSQQNSSLYDCCVDCHKQKLYFKQLLNYLENQKRFIKFLKFKQKFNETEIKLKCFPLR